MATKIKWQLIQVKAGDLKPNPNNPKIRNEAGYNRLVKVSKKYGIIFHGIINKDKSIIDGHTRISQEKPDTLINVFAPSRQLSADEYKELNALFDLAKAGDIDTQILEEQFNDKFFDEWGIDKAKSNIVSFQAKPKVKEFKVVVRCENEQQQKKLFEKLTKDGLKVSIEK